MIQYSNIKAYNQIWSPMGRYPMVDNSIFETYQEALTFATTNAVAVVGSLITVTNDSVSTNNGVYQLIYNGEAPLSSSTQPTGLKKVGDVDLSNYATKQDIASVYKVKGSVATEADLPATAAEGDVYNVIDSGKNFVWVKNLTENKDGWDDLGGIVDLSPYALAANVNSKFETVEGSIATNAGSIQTINQTLNTKVDKVEGSSLITSEKLALIDTNASEILTLKSEDNAIKGRLDTIEGFFKGTDDQGNNIGLGTINTQLANHETRIGALETADQERLNQIGTLMTFKTNTEKSLETLVANDTQQAGLISGLTTTLNETNATVAGHTTSISTLTGLVSTNTQDIANIQSSIQGLAVKSVKSDEKILAANTNGELYTTIGLASHKDSDGKTWIDLTGIEGAVINSFDASAFVLDGMIDTITYDPQTQNMVITWNDDSGKSEAEKTVTIPLSGLVDTYTAGSGLIVDNNEFSVVLSTSDKNKLSFDAQGGLLVDISGDIKTLEETMDSKIADAFEWITA